MKPKIKIFFDYEINSIENKVNEFIKNNFEIDEIIDIKYNVIYSSNSHTVLHYITLIYN